MKKLLIALACVIGVVCFVIVIITIVNNSSNSTIPPPSGDKNKTENASDDKTSTTKSVETFVDKGEVGPNKTWTTPYVDYKNRVEAGKSHSIYLEYTKEGGGWTEKVCLEPGQELSTLPKGGTQGPIRVSTEETTTFEVSLYKIN